MPPLWTSFPGFKGAIIIKGIKQVFGRFTSHGRQGMGPEKKESHLGEDLLTVGEEKPGLFPSRLKDIEASARVGGRVIQVMAAASKGDVAQGSWESEWVHFPSAVPPVSFYRYCFVCVFEPVAQTQPPRAEWPNQSD